MMLGPYFVTTEPRRMAAWGSPCKVPFATVRIERFELKCHRLVVPAFQRWEQIRASHGYALPGTDTGFYSCRHMRHDPSLPWSSHSWAIALDENWLQNPAGSKLVTDMPLPMIHDLEMVKTNSGVYVFMWGGDWDKNPRTGHTYFDAMHWEVIAHPLDLATGIASPLVTTTFPPANLTDVQTIKLGERGNHVRALQSALAKRDPVLGITADGIYGDATQRAINAYQRAANLPETVNHIDGLTVTYILTIPIRL